MATHGDHSLPPTALGADPPTGAAVDGAHTIADLLPSKEVDVPGTPASNPSDIAPSKQENLDAAPERSKGKVALIMSALLVSLALSGDEFSGTLKLMAPCRLPSFSLRLTQ